MRVLFSEARDAIDTHRKVAYRQVQRDQLPGDAASTGEVREDHAQLCEY